MTVVNPKSISGINSITMASGSDDLLTIHSNNTTERVRVNNSGDVIVGSGITLSPDGDIFATGITTVSGNVKVGTGITLSPDGDGFFTGVVTATTFKGDGSQLSNVTSTTINNNADNRLITGSGTANTLEAESTLTFDASLLNISSTTQGLGTRFTNTGNEYTMARFDAARTGANLALGILEGRWNNTHNVCSIYLQSGSDTTNKDDGQISFLTAGSGGSQASRMVIKNDGDVSITDGNLVVATSGHGIDFSATGGPTNGSDSSELLDDYEEGTWTATMQDGNGSNVTLTSQDNTYTKIGRIVHVQGNFTLDDSGKSGEIVLKSLPYNGLAASQLACGHFWVDRSQPSNDTIGGVMYKTSGNDRAYFVNPTLGGSGGSSPSQRYFQFGDWANGRPIYFSMTYQA